MEICQNGIWGSVCSDDDWDVLDARVVCRQFGFDFNGIIIHAVDLCFMAILLLFL